MRSSILQLASLILLCTIATEVNGQSKKRSSERQKIERVYITSPENSGTAILDNWMVGSGDNVEDGEVIGQLDINGEKVDILANASGRLRLIAQKGNEIQPGTKIAAITKKAGDSSPSITSDQDNEASDRNDRLRTTDGIRQETGTLMDKLWFGAGFNLGVSSGYFQAGLSPMVGYKLDKKGILSVGPRISLDYSSQRIRDFSNNVIKFNAMNYGLGVFTRGRIFSGLFAHVEYQRASQKIPRFSGSVPVLNEDNTKILGDREGFNNFFVGGGWSSGFGPSKFEFSILYNVNQDDVLQELDPIEYRAAFTFNF